MKKYLVCVLKAGAEPVTKDRLSDSDWDRAKKGELLIVDLESKEAYVRGAWQTIYR